MTVDEFLASVKTDAPPEMVSPSLVALWYDAKGDWERAHGMVDSLESNEGMAVHAYLHRKQGDNTNANYWYARVGRKHYRPVLNDEWHALVRALLD